MEFLHNYYLWIAVGVIVILALAYFMSQKK